MTEGTDIPAFDLVKNRHFGMAPYVKYVELWHGISVNTFDDLIGVIKPEVVNIHIVDIQLINNTFTTIMNVSFRVLFQVLYCTYVQTV